MLSYDVYFPYLGLKFKLMPVAFSIFGFEVMWYGIIIASAVLFGFAYIYNMADSFKINKDQILNIAALTVVISIIGARVYYILFYPGDFYIKNPMNIFYIHQGGLAIYGGIIAGIITLVVISKLKKIPILPLLDLSAIGLIIGQCIGRWGNFVNQEAFGRATNFIFAMQSEATGMQGVHPCFLYESFWCLLGFVFLHLFNKYLKKQDGEVALLYLIWYGFGRFFIESLRTDSLYIMETNIKVSQALALACFVFALVMFISIRLKLKVKGK